MIYLYNALIIIGTVILMEGVAWALHKYILHGLLWFIHEDHHRKRYGLTEKNDLVAFIFAIPSWLLIMFGVMAGNDIKLYLGIGVTIYGALYFLFHDGLIHGRIKVFQNPKSVYLLGCKIGHLAHHKHDMKKDYDRKNDVAWGMLWVPREYFKMAREHLNASKQVQKVSK